MDNGVLRYKEAEQVEKTFAPKPFALAAGKDDETGENARPCERTGEPNRRHVDQVQAIYLSLQEAV